MYETHSALSAENEDMVRRAISEANRAARELHALRRIRAREALPKAPKCASQPQAVNIYLFIERYMIFNKFLIRNIYTF